MTPTLRALATCSALANLAYALHAAVVLVYLARDLALAPALQGAILAVGSASGLPARSWRIGSPVARGLGRPSSAPRR